MTSKNRNFILVVSALFLLLPTLSLAEENMPATTESMPAASESMPATTESMPAAKSKVDSMQPMAADFSVGRLVIAGAVENREPMDVAATFPASTPKVYAFLEAKDIKADTQATIVWRCNGEEMAQVPLRLKAGNRWRTWSSKQIGGRTGDWTVAVQAADGMVLKEATFKVE